MESTRTEWNNYRIMENTREWMYSGQGIISFNGWTYTVPSTSIQSLKGKKRLLL